MEADEFTLMFRLIAKINKSRNRMRIVTLMSFYFVSIEKKRIQWLLGWVSKLLGTGLQWHLHNCLEDWRDEGGFSEWRGSKTCDLHTKSLWEKWIAPDWMVESSKEGLEFYSRLLYRIVYTVTFIPNRYKVYTVDHTV